MAPTYFMIEVTRLNGDIFVLNAIYIEKVEALPDTTITLIHGKKHFVKESVDEVIRDITKFYQQIGMADLHTEVVRKDE